MVFAVPAAGGGAQAVTVVPGLSAQGSHPGSGGWLCLWQLLQCHRCRRLFHQWLLVLLPLGVPLSSAAVSYTHLTLPTNREV